MAFYDKFVNLCASIGEKPTPVAQKLGISKGTVASWKRRGNDPTDAYLAKIANYFGVSVDDLRGDSEKEKKPAAQGDGLKLDSYEDIDQWLGTLDGKGLDMVIALAIAKKVKNNEDKP